MATMDTFRKERVKATKDEVQKVAEKIAGAVIERINFRFTWDEENVSGITLYLKGGEKIEIEAGSERGCNECDPEGSLNDYLIFS